MSIFVNPTQFNNARDFETYPITVEADLVLAENAGVDVVFLPTVDDLYGGVLDVDPVNYGPLTHAYEGQMRAGHFDGVVAVVRKLFQAVRPDRAFFGEKDLQQLAVIRRLALEEFPGLEVVGCPLVRDSDGLALSSRNVRLNVQERQRALQLSQWIQRIQKDVADGAGAGGALERVLAEAQTSEGLELEYLDLVNAETFESCRDVPSGASVYAVVAAKVGDVRLIDNCPVMCS